MRSATQQLFVKICGITRAQDAELAVSLGANAIGFVFWTGSPRHVSPSVAKRIGELVAPQVRRVGVFVDEPLDGVVRAAAEAELDAVQLHGRETPAYCRSLKARLDERGRGNLIKAIPIGTNGSAVAASFDPDVLLLADVHDPARYGGTGRTVDWDAARALAAGRPTILAGGLNAGNITLAVRTVQPYGVDVSSGVESSPGIKDPNRMRSFFEALHV